MSANWTDEQFAQYADDVARGAGCDPSYDCWAECRRLAMESLTQRLTGWAKPVSMRYPEGMPLD